MEYVSLCLSQLSTVWYIFEGETRDAINEHETELSFCEDLKDLLGEAVACRKLGECYMELGEFDTALEVRSYKI